LNFLTPELLFIHTAISKTELQKRRERKIIGRVDIVSSVTPDNTANKTTGTSVKRAFMMSETGSGGSREINQATPAKKRHFSPPHQYQRDTLQKENDIPCREERIK